MTQIIVIREFFSLLLLFKMNFITAITVCNYSFPQTVYFKFKVKPELFLAKPLTTREYSQPPEILIEKRKCNWEIFIRGNVQILTRDVVYPIIVKVNFYHRNVYFGR